jgi:hypothetical protein
LNNAEQNVALPVTTELLDRLSTGGGDVIAAAPGSDDGLAAAAGVPSTLGEYASAFPCGLGIFPMMVASAACLCVWRKSPALPRA